MTMRLTTVYIAASTLDGAPVLRCTDHDQWYADADAEDLPTVIRRGTEHIREMHRVHVADCMCRGTRIIDQRCIPTD